MENKTPDEAGFIESIENCKIPRWVAYKNQLDNLEYDEFIRKVGEDINSILLDVRSQEEFETGSLNRAINFNYLSNTLADEIEQLDPSLNYYIFCRTGRRSLRVCMLLKNSGFKVYNLDEGISGKIEFQAKIS